MLFVRRGINPFPSQWPHIVFTSLLIPLLVIANQANFDLEKSLSTSCDRHCYNGVCLNGSCVCSKGWVGSQCDHCYGRIKVTENHSHLIDGPLDYSPSSKCTWLIESEKKVGAPLNIRLENFQTECGWDFVYIYDGDGVYGEQLAAFCGEQEVQELSAPSGKALIYFFSDLAMNLSGFNITYEFERCPYNCNSHGSCQNSQCVCDHGFTGDYCEVRVCTKEDEDKQGPCLHGGICKDSRCSCATSYHGDTCQMRNDRSVWDRITTSKAPAGRASHASVLIDDVIWSIGGEHFSGVVFEDPVLFNITSRSWKSVVVGGKVKPGPRFDHTLVRYKTKLFMYGGVIDRRNITSELWSFDLHTKEWTQENGENRNLTIPPLAVSGHTAHVIGSEMYVIFGYHPEIGFVHNIQIYNFETGRWRFGNTKDQVYGRFRHTSVHYKMDSGDAILVYGGTMWSNTQNNLTDSLMRYDIKHEKWANLPPSGVQLFLHTATILNGLMIVVGGNGYNISESRTKQECFSSMVQAYDIACKQWFNISSDAVQLRRYGHTAVATNYELYVIGGFNGKMLNDVWRFSAAECSSATRPEECRSLIDGVKCIFTERACVRFDPFVSYKQSFLSFVKNEVPKSMSECRNTALRQALQTCEDYTDCMSCISEPACGWCPSGDQCLPNEGECVDGQMMHTTWEKCSSSRGPPPPRPCGMANDCRSCKLLSHCNWYTADGKPACIPLEDEILLRKEQLDRELDRVASSSLPLRLPTTPPPIPPGQNLSYCPLPCSSLYTCSECLQEQKCMWCPSTSRCINMEAYALSFAYGQCPSWVAGHAHGFAFSKSCRIESSNCSTHKTCAECHLSPECGWLDDGSRTGLGTCTRGSARGPLERSPDFQQHQWYFIDCPACQCNGHSMCNETRQTFGGVQEVCGECQNNTMGKHCEICAPGYHGDPRNGDNCSPCQCNGQADTCDHITGTCHCRTKGVSGASCDRCDQKYYGQPKNGTPCYYELSVDFIFTFKLKNEDKDKHATEIYLFSIPHKKDTDVTFQISCDGGSQANVALNITSSLFESTPRRMMLNTTCDAKGFRRVYVASDPDYAYGTDANTTFFVRVFNFTTPITIQVSFAQSPPINWVLFFVIFAACFIVLLVVAGLLWMIKLRIEVYRRNQRRIDEIEHMASRPFSSVKLELTSPHCFSASGPVQGPTPLSVEPCSNYKSGIFTLAVRLPTGGRATTPNGTSGLAVASALCLLTPAQLGVLQAPDNSENRNNRKTTLRSYIPFLRARMNDTT
ncbi:hypothetical protein V3C99_017466 [Haemonchus contortus]